MKDYWLIATLLLIAMCAVAGAVLLASRQRQGVAHRSAPIGFLSFGAEEA